MSSGDLEGRVALVTGATRGTGLGIAQRLHAEGAAVVVNGRDSAACAALADDLGDERGMAAPRDVGDPGAVDAMVGAVLERWGRIDIAVNNAGVALDNFVTGVTDERWDRTLATNLSGPLFVTRAVVRPMKDQEGGVILNVTSWAGIRGNVGQAAYSASKAGLYGLTLSCAKELGKFGIRVNAIAPAVATAIASEMPDELKAKAARRRPLRLDGTVDDVAEAAAFLVSDRSRFITGQLVNVDGGMHLT